MTDPKEPKTAPNAFHGEGDTDTGVVTESVVDHDTGAKPATNDPSGGTAKDAVDRIERNEGIEPGP